MESYHVVRRIGQGAFGEVTECTEKSTGFRCAVKVISNKRYETWDECLKLREVRSLRRLGSTHKHIVVLRQIIRENKKLFLVFDYHPTNLHRRIQEVRASKKEHLPTSKIASWTYQLISAIAYMHRYGFFHRDLKPENLLLDSNDGIQVCDFGLARDVRSRPPFTEYISTKWYRAPELVLRSSNYNSPVDLWAIGCVMAEAIMLNPMFPANDAIEHIMLISKVLGPINSSTWSLGYSLGLQKKIPMPKSQSTMSLHSYLLEQWKCRCHVVHAEESAQISQGISLVCDLLQLDPGSRPRASQALKHEFIRDMADVQDMADMQDTPFEEEEIAACQNDPVDEMYQLAMLTKEVDDLTLEIQQIKTSPSNRKLNIQVLDEKPIPAPCLTPQVPEIDRTATYLNILTDDEEDDEDNLIVRRRKSKSEKKKKKERPSLSSRQESSSTLQVIELEIPMKDTFEIEDNEAKYIPKSEEYSKSMWNGPTHFESFDDELEVESIASDCDGSMITADHTTNYVDTTTSIGCADNTSCTENTSCVLCESMSNEIRLLEEKCLAQEKVILKLKAALHK